MILLYRGTSILSKLIRFFSWSLSGYSHASWAQATVDGAWLKGDTTEWESWTKNGVCHPARIGDNHTKGTRIDLYELRDPLTFDEREPMTHFLQSKVGQKYDWWGVIHFLTRGKSDIKGRWFCSEYVFAALRASGRVILQNVEAFQVYPAMLSYSPEVIYVGYILSGHDFQVHQDPVKLDRHGIGILRQA